MRFACTACRNRNAAPGPCATCSAWRRWRRAGSWSRADASVGSQPGYDADIVVVDMERPSWFPGSRRKCDPLDAAADAREQARRRHRACGWGGGLSRRRAHPLRSARAVPANWRKQAAAGSYPAESAGGGTSAHSAMSRTGTGPGRFGRSIPIRATILASDPAGRLHASEDCACARSGRSGGRVPCGGRDRRRDRRWRPAAAWRDHAGEDAGDGARPRSYPPHAHLRAARQRLPVT